MVFTSTAFIFIFLPLVFAIYYCPVFKKSRKFRNGFLLLASLMFYAWGEPFFVFLMIISIVVSWIIGLGLARYKNTKKQKVILVIGVVYHLSILVVFKYLSFISQELNKLINYEITVIDIALPIGISFFTFQMMSYLFDVYYGKAKEQRNIFYLGLYVSLFPQLIAGPIVRYETIEYEILHRKENREDFQEGLKRFVIGLGKKALLADFLAIIADRVFQNAGDGEISMLTAWIGAIAYMFEIYFDFSGYSDMAIGLGRCFGFHFKENFNYPYIAESISDFWRRWHMSLTNWFRDYVYIPIGGNRVSARRHIFNIAFIWMLTGIWHGANWTFLVWGMIYCVFQILERYCYNTQKWPKVFRHIYTLSIVLFCWVIFKADNLSAAFKYLGYMFGNGRIIDEQGIMYLENGIIIILSGGILSMPIYRMIEEKIKTNKIKILKETIMYLIMGIILVMTAVFSISGGYSPFIYFNF